MPVDPTPESLGAFVERVPDGTPLVMLNLLRFRDVADYPDPEPQVSGREAYEHYGAAGPALPRRRRRAARVAGSRARVSDRARRESDGTRACWCEYPSKAAFLEMVGNPDYQAITVHRTAALADSRLVPMVEAHRIA